jgi:O-Antigen ligase
VDDRLAPAAGPFATPKASSSRASLRHLLLIAFFVFCMSPVSIFAGGVGVGVNYAFLLLPLAVALIHGRLRYPGDRLTLAAMFYALVFFVATLYQVDQFALSGRRFASFVVFMSMFAYAFITIDERMVAAFKTALVVSSAYLSLVSAYTLLVASATAIVGFEAKNMVGSQRFGFIYLIAFWLAYLDPAIKRSLGSFRYPVLLVLLGGLMLTFSRSSIVSLLGGFLLFAFVRHGKWLRNLSTRVLLNGLATVGGILVCGLILYWLFPVAFRFFDARLFTFFSNEDTVLTALVSRESSEGTRVFIAMSVLEFVVRNPLTGSGYLGVWTIPELAAGSAHGQYVDVLFRTGPVGLVFYLGIFFAVLRYLRRQHEALFWGVLSAGIYGLFHETFKESQGGFVYAVLVGMLAQSLRERRDARRRMAGVVHA